MLLFSQNKVGSSKPDGTAPFTVILVQLNKGEEATVEAKNINATGSEVTPFPGGAVKTDEVQIIKLSGVLSVQKVLGKMAVIGSGLLDWRYAASS